jgi:predicted transcriptional regulator
MKTDAAAEPTHEQGLARRERQLMDVIWRRGEGTAAEVLAALPDPPSYSAVRALLRVLEEKGHLCHVRQGARYVYRPTVPAERARRSALLRLVDTFFAGSVSQAAATLLDVAGRRMSGEELNTLAELIAARRDEGG